MTKKLYKSRTDVKIDGVCAGLSKYLGIDVTLIRLIWVCMVLFGGSGILLYIVCALLMPREASSNDYFDINSN